MISGNVYSAGLVTLIGILLFFLPGMSIRLVCRALGCVILVIGAIFLAAFVKKKEELVGKAELTGGIVFALIGLFVLINPDVIASILPVVAGVLVAAHGIGNLSRAFSLLKLKDKSWLVALIFGILSVVVGLIFLTNPFSTATMIVRLVGLFFLIDGIGNLWLILRLGKAQKSSGAIKEPVDVDAKIEDL